MINKYQNIFSVLILLFNSCNSCPINCKCDAEFKYINCSWLMLSTEPEFNNLTEIIYLSNNQLSSIHKNTFQNLFHLREIYLSNNYINFIEHETFMNNINLEIVDLKENNLEIFICSIFPINNKITSIDISKNYLNIFDCNGYSLIFLKYLSLSNNNLYTFPFHSFFNGLENLNSLDLSYNLIPIINLSNPMTNLNSLYLQYNKLTKFYVKEYVNYPNLKYLNLGNNELQSLNSNSFRNMPNLITLIISDNPLSYITDGAFEFLNNLNNLFMDGLLINALNNKSLDGLYNLKKFSMNNNYKSTEIDSYTFVNTKLVTSVSISNSSLLFLDVNILHSLPFLTYLYISGNKFICDCRFKQTVSLINDLKVNDKLIIDDVICSFPIFMNGISALSSDYLTTPCSKLTQVIANEDREVLSINEMHALVSSQVIMPCTVIEIFPSDDYWWFKRGRNNELLQFSNQQTDSKHFVYENGSLIIYEINRTDFGYYYCKSLLKGYNKSSVTLLMMNVEYMRKIELHSLFWALMSVLIFVSIAILIALLRLCTNLCSGKERKKRKSIHEVLQNIRSSMHMNKFSFYRSAQMERISALRSATLDHLSSFKSARVDDIRRYKHATVNTVLHCLERMRVHYSGQTARIKDHCTSHVHKLRANYMQQCSRLKDKKSKKFKKIRHRYNNQAIKIRDYSNQHMTRLRDQYKQQQQHLIKLLELLEIGNCMNIIETDCSHAESIIFDAHLDLSLSSSEEDFNLNVDQPLLVETSTQLHDIENEEDEEDDDDEMGMDFDLSMDDFELIEVDLFKEEEWDHIATEISSLLAEEGSAASSQTIEELKQNLAEARKNFFSSDSSKKIYNNDIKDNNIKYFNDTVADYKSKSKNNLIGKNAFKNNSFDEYDKEYIEMHGDNKDFKTNYSVKACIESNNV